jgi:hypothetical protein
LILWKLYNRRSAPPAGVVFDLNEAQMIIFSTKTGSNKEDKYEA